MSIDIAGPACYSFYDSAEVPCLMSEELAEVDSSSYTADVLDLDLVS